MLPALTDSDMITEQKTTVQTDKAFSASPTQQKPAHIHTDHAIYSSEKAPTLASLELEPEKSLLEHAVEEQRQSFASDFYKKTQGDIKTSTTVKLTSGPMEHPFAVLDEQKITPATTLTPKDLQTTHAPLELKPMLNTKPNIIPLTTTENLTPVTSEQKILQKSHTELPKTHKKTKPTTPMYTAETVKVMCAETYHKILQDQLFSYSLQ